MRSARSLGRGELAKPSSRLISRKAKAQAKKASTLSIDEASRQLARDEASQTLKEYESEIAKEQTATSGAFPKSPAKGKKPLQSTSSKDDPSSSSSSQSSDDEDDKMCVSGTTEVPDRSNTPRMTMKIQNPSGSHDQQRIWTLGHSIEGMKMFENTYCYMVVPKQREEKLDTMAAIQEVEPKTHTDKHWKSSEKRTSQETNLLDTYENDSNHQDIQRSFTQSS